MTRLHFRDLAWLLLVLFGTGAFVLALDFRFGTVNNIGSAVYPLALSAVIVLISLYALLLRRRPAAGDDDASPLDRRPFVAIIAAVVLFCLVVEQFGIVPAVVVSMIVAYTGQGEGNYRFVAVYAALFAFGTWALFSYGLSLPLAAFRMP